MKKFEDVEPGDITIDYNGEAGIIVRKIQRGEPLFDRLTKDLKEECPVWEKGAIEVEGDEYGTFGGIGKVVFVYGHDGAYVPTIKK